MLFFLFPVKCIVVTTNWSSFMSVTVIKYPEKEQCSQGKGLLSSQSHWGKSELESELVSLQTKIIGKKKIYVSGTLGRSCHHRQPSEFPPYLPLGTCLSQPPCAPSHPSNANFMSHRGHLLWKDISQHQLLNWSNASQVDLMVSELWASLSPILGRANVLLPKRGK